MMLTDANERDMRALVKSLLEYGAKLRRVGQDIPFARETLAFDLTKLGFDAENIRLIAIGAA